MAATLPKPVRIALADDNAEFRRLLSHLLRILGYEVVCEAADGAELLAQCHDGVDVALVDLDMPEVDGLTAAEELSQRGIPVVLLSGHPDLRQVVAEHEPIAARLLKPTTPEKLQAAIAQALQSRDGSHQPR